MNIRGFTQLLAITVAAVIALQLTAEAQTGQPQVRMRWQNFIDGQEGAKRLASLQKAVLKMKSLDGSNVPEDFRRSWRYWANIHGYYGPSSRDGTVQGQIDYLRQNGLEQYIPFYDGITDQTPPDSIAQAGGGRGATERAQLQRHARSSGPRLMCGSSRSSCVPRRSSRGD